MLVIMDSPAAHCRDLICDESSVIAGGSSKGDIRRRGVNRADEIRCPGNTYGGTVGRTIDLKRLGKLRPVEVTNTVTAGVNITLDEND